MSIRALDNNHDWNFGHGLQDYNIEQNEIIEDLKTRISSYKNDCFFDMDAGINWDKYIGSFGQVENLKKELTDIISTTNNVLTINNLEVYLNEKRNLIISSNISTIYSKQNINIELEV